MCLFEFWFAGSGSYALFELVSIGFHGFCFCVLRFVFRVVFVFVFASCVAGVCVFICCLFFVWFLLPPPLSLCSRSPPPFPPPPFFGGLRPPFQAPRNNKRKPEIRNAKNCRKCKLTESTESFFLNRQPVNSAINIDNNFDNNNSAACQFYIDNFFLRGRVLLQKQFTVPLSSAMCLLPVLHR